MTGTFSAYSMYLKTKTFFLPQLKLRSVVPVNKLAISVTALDGMDTAWL